MTRLWFYARFMIVLALILVCPGIQPVRAQEQTRAEELLQAMSVEEKVGQLFLVTFEGSQVDEESQIYQLITDYHIGGVVLSAGNNNFTGEETIVAAQQLTLSLQEIAWAAASTGDDRGQAAELVYVPLLIGLEQLGNGYPGDQILSGLTKFPSHFAIGASWDVALANRVGEGLGAELSALGINLFLGPNLDVLEDINNESAISLGVNAFGGNPFWVGEMGRAYISGLHTGSNNRMLVIARNFPGTGNADRPPGQEVSTVRKSLEQLRQVELAPYFSVSMPELGEPGRVDGLMISHNRYQGFQGNIRSSTRPISFDSNALQLVFSLPEFVTWREDGGLIISDNLGSGAIRRFFDPNGVNFDARQVARNAFLAGNDMLYVDDLISTGDPDTYTTLVATLDSFAQKYREDSAFARRVDTSVLRILEAKLALYDDFSLPMVLDGFGDVEDLGIAQEITFDVAQAAVTLISPSALELDTLLPEPPLSSDDVMIFTDVRLVSQCETCMPVPNVSPNALANALVSLYGPQAGGQIVQSRLASYTFTQLAEFLDNLETDAAELITTNIRAANWLIFNTLDISPEQPASNALQRILAERPDLLSGKNVIVFTMGSPTYLDATDISKVTAYYGLHSKAPAFLDVAARVLMHEYDPPGALPVSLGAAGYDLNIITQPNPNQVIRLELVLPVANGNAANDQTEQGEESDDDAEQTATPAVTETPEPTPLPIFNVGDNITIRTSRILDHNQNIVPDGTIVRFSFRISGEPGITQQFEAPTSGGVAFFNYRIESAGGMDVTASSGPAAQSETLQINISPEGLLSIFAFTPTPMVSPTAEPTPTATMIPTLQPTPTSTPTPIPVNYPSLGDWAIGVLVMGMGGVLTFMVGLLWWGSARWGLRSALSALIGGLLSYTYLNLGLEGTKRWIQQSGRGFVIEIVVAGLLIGWIVALVWWMRTEGRYPKRNRR